MNWEGLCLSPKAYSQPEIVVLTDPFPSENPEVVVAAVYRDGDRADSQGAPDIIISASEWPGPGHHCHYIDQTAVQLAKPDKIEFSINPRFLNLYAIAGNLSPIVVIRLRKQISNSPHVSGVVKEHLEAWLPF